MGGLDDTGWRRFATIEEEKAAKDEKGFFVSHY
jgi:hypothetical protein